METEIISAHNAMLFAESIRNGQVDTRTFVFFKHYFQTLLGQPVDQMSSGGRCYPKRSVTFSQLTTFQKAST